MKKKVRIFEGRIYSYFGMKGYPNEENYQKDTQKHRFSHIDSIRSYKPNILGSSNLNILIKNMMDLI